ncbi:hypothetical protein NC981_23250, partial [Leptolyngbya sp. DQ-M1]|uniref:MnhB domain-containing protein n=1 Tax=Leptolyngbya sp. DQ-M1 TaxID=2933920 RepID=UPI0032997E69
QDDFWEKMMPFEQRVRRHFEQDQRKLGFHTLPFLRHNPAIGLVAITSSSQWMEAIYQRWRAATWEKVSVIVFIVLSVITLIGFDLPYGQLGSLISGGAIPLLNILVAIKVALGSWAVVLIFIRYRGLL